MFHPKMKSDAKSPSPFPSPSQLSFPLSRNANRNFAMISLSIGFLVIWTAVIAGILVSNTVNDNIAAKDTLKIFRTHEEIGRLIFAIGHELVSTVDLLVSSESFKSNARMKHISEAIDITWKMTDSVVERIKNDIELKPNDLVMGMDNLITMVEIRLAKYRASSVYIGSNPLNAIEFYINLCESIINKCFTINAVSMNGLVRRHSPHPSTAYALFIKGMSKRFAELAFGTVYVRSDLLLNKTQYFHLHYGSRELFENAFELNPRAQMRYWDLLEQNPHILPALQSIGEDMLMGSLNRGSNQFAAVYLNTVRDEIAMLLRAKDFFNSSLSSQIYQLSDSRQRLLAFHMSIAFIALSAVILCLLFYCCSVRNTNVKNNRTFQLGKQNNDSDIKKSKESIYSVDFNDSDKILRSNF